MLPGTKLVSKDRLEGGRLVEADQYASYARRSARSACAPFNLRLGEVGRSLSKREAQAQVEQTYQYCMRILSSRMSSSIVQDDLHLADLIKKRLMRRDKTSTSAVQFSNLYNKLSAQDNLHNKWAVLSFLSAISGQADNVEPVDASVNNAFATFGLRKLPQATASSSSFTQPDTQRPREDDDSKTPLPSKPYNSYYAKSHKAQTEVTESMLLRDIIYVFQGIDGKYVRYDPSADSFLVNPETGVPRPLREIIRRLAETGWLYRRIHDHVQKAKTETKAGLVGQSFCSALSQELTDYYRLIAVLEAQIAREQQAGSFAAKGLSLKRLHVWTMEPLHRLRMMSVLIDLCAGEKGGALISIVHNYVNHGDPFVQMFIHRLLSEISKPFYDMLRRWIYEGELEDPFDEFFVAVDMNADDGNLWRAKYTLRYDMVPSFLSRAVAKKIFLIGKSLNFIRHTCAGDAYVVSRSALSVSAKGLTYGDLGGLEESVEKSYKGVSGHLLEILFGRYRLMDHFVALKKYLLLGAGDFVQFLMDELGDALNKPASTIYRHNLTAVLESAIRSSNAQHDDADIVKRLDVRLLEASQGDTGWDIFALDYHVQGALSTIFTTQAMHAYLKLFTFLWRVKRVEHALAGGWRRRGRRSLVLRRILPEISHDLQHCHILHAEMSHFILQLQYYILFEVIECSWEELMDVLEKRGEGWGMDLDAVIGAHNRYLNCVSQKGLLGGVGGGGHNIPSKLLKIFDTILAFGEACEGLLKWGEVEMRVRGLAMRTRYQKSVEDKWGLSEVEQDASGRYGEERGRDSEGEVRRLRKRVEVVGGVFRDELKSLLGVLGKEGDETLRGLSVRLDFNHYYAMQGVKDAAGA
ncbi:Gamma-tubulin complex component 3 [Rhizophlyctis rosea]|nr:Gamma-tubulin complex component 3 [Rhizophlyctis rosea]